jgi:hypothetical protein
MKPTVTILTIIRRLIVGALWFISLVTVLSLGGSFAAMLAGQGTFILSPSDAGKAAHTVFLDTYFVEILLLSLVVSISGASGQLLWGTGKRLTGKAPAPPKNISTDMAYGYGAGAFIGGATACVWLYHIFAVRVTVVPMAEAAIVNVIETLFLAYGVYKGSRACAITLLLLYMMNVYERLDGNTGTSAMVFQMLFFMWCLWRGIKGTFNYHRWQKELDINGAKPTAVAVDVPA